MARRRILVEWLAVALLASIAVVWLARGHVAARLDYFIYDVLLSLESRPTPDDIVVVAIDTTSLSAIGPWPWPRSVHEQVIRRIAGGGAKAIGYDILFVEPDPNPAADAALASAIRGAGSVALPILVEVPGPNGAAYRLAPPVPPLSAAARALGHVNLDLDEDGLVRRAVLLERGERLSLPHLAEQLYRMARGRPSPAFVAAREAPIGAGLIHDRQVLIAYAGPPGHFRTIGADAVLNGTAPDGLFKNQIVLVGATAEGLGDAYPTPALYSTGIRPGVDLQANLLDTLLRDRVVRPSSLTLAVVFALTPVWLLLLGFLRLSPRINIRLGLGLIVGTLAVSALAMVAGRLWLPPGAPVLVMIATYPLWAWRRLEAVDTYMLGELTRLNAEPVLLPVPNRQALRGDIVGERIALLETSIDRIRTLRRFVSDMLRDLPDATVAVGADGAIFLANAAADALAKSLNSRAAIGMQESAWLTGFVDEGYLSLPDGRSFDLRRVPLLDASGSAIGHITRLSDVTQITAAARQRDAILQLLTHDMRSPQASILALLDTSTGTMPPELGKRIGGLARQTLKLTDDFVQLARAEQVGLVTEELDLGALLTEAADDLWPQSNSRGIAVTIDDGGDEHLVMGDRSLLARALTNILNNAIKYSGDHTRIDCRLRTESGAIHCTIRDQGRGMTVEQVAQLFQPFRRQVVRGHRDPGGAGLALSFVKTVVARHNGTIECESILGQGTEFRIALPAA